MAKTKKSSQTARVIQLPIHEQRFMMRGVRLGGSSVFQLELFGNAECHFAPMSLQMSLRELGEWLEAQQEANRNKASKGPVKLYAV